MSQIDLLESARPGPFTFRHGGEVFEATHPADLHYQDLLLALQTEHVPDIPNMSLRKAARLFRGWAAHHDLPSFGHAQRLCYLVDRYRDPLEFDLHVRARADLSEMWRSRQWRRLLNMVDHLPSDCWYSEAVSKDEEHAELMRKAIAEQDSGEDSSPSHPPVHAWSPEMGVLADLIDAIRTLNYTVGAVQGAKMPQPDPYRRPKTLLEAARKRGDHQRREAKHKALVRRMLPNKADLDD